MQNVHISSCALWPRCSLRLTDAWSLAAENSWSVGVVNWTVDYNVSVNSDSSFSITGNRSGFQQNSCTTLLHCLLNVKMTTSCKLWQTYAKLMNCERLTKNLKLNLRKTYAKLMTTWMLQCVWLTAVVCVCVSRWSERLAARTLWRVGRPRRQPGLSHVGSCEAWNACRSSDCSVL